MDIQANLLSANASSRLQALRAIREELAEGNKNPQFFDWAAACIDDSDNDCRWQSLIIVGEFMDHRKSEIWEICRKYGISDDDDMRDAIATILLEHLIESPLYKELARELASCNLQFASTLARCWEF